MDPDHRYMSHDFQDYLIRNNIQLLLTAADSHWQLGKVEVCNRILPGMAQKVWKSGIHASPEEIIENCATTRNEQLRKCGFSPSQWFLGRDTRHAGALSDVDEQRNLVSQSQVLADPSFAEKVRLRDAAAQAFLEEHAKDTRRRAIAGKNRQTICPRPDGVHV